MTATNSVKQYRMRKLIASLSGREGREKDFVSLYIPREQSTDEVITILREKLDSDEIRSQSNRDRVQDVLTKLMHHLKLQKEIPENGLAIFAASAADHVESEGSDIEEIAPPEPITAYLFAVDDHFDLEPLREMLREDRVVGLIAMDAKTAGFGVLSGDSLELVDDITSGVPGRSGKGGSSQRRYERGRDMELTYYFHRVAEHATEAFLANRRVTGLIVGGPGLTKDKFLSGDYLSYELKNMLLARVDTLGSGKEGVKEAFEKSAETLKSIHTREEEKIMQRLEEDVGKQNGLAIFGLNPVLDALKNGVAEVALVADNTDMTEIIATCKRCGLSRSRMVDKEKHVQTAQEMISDPCEKCHAVEYKVEDRDIIDALEDLASQTDARVEVISASEENATLRTSGGFAALLRYRI
jgi:peptide chain release factor subunit 1